MFVGEERYFCQSFSPAFFVILYGCGGQSKSHKARPCFVPATRAVAPYRNDESPQANPHRPRERAGYSLTQDFAIVYALSEREADRQARAYPMSLLQSTFRSNLRLLYQRPLASRRRDSAKALSLQRISKESALKEQRNALPCNALSDNA